MSLSNTLSAASTLIGYIGTEVATTDCFNRVLWPQRSYNNFSLRNAWIPALLMPLGGPLYTAALKTVDTFLRNGLFLRPNLGNMLGTAFFPDSGMHYHLYEDGVRSREAQVRNGIWVQVLQEMPMIAERMEKKVEGQVEDGSQKRGHIRQLTPVNHLILSPARAEKPPPNVRMRRFSIDQDIGAVTLRTIVAIITTEITGVSVAIAVAVIWRSAFMVLWLVPLVLKLITTTQTSGETPTTTNFLITSGQGFHIIEGPPHIVLQFFRHYGHPRRSQWNERVQIAVVFAFGLNFPVGLVVSIMCMPTTLQCVWTGYVLYATLAIGRAYTDPA
ncbi:hypothetical protein NUU61_000985 [Penicillium alfredii]|uniref:Uncharacterized protein n=1 Tax=Penicillium alfredii TaxID=1506179 RepID=A0A9W9GAM4_9EURO|nr:uncharacterized protein NUU61_000985 [Penicillium alfredii]KAJ5115226.1 hypothetical protein NUU61_000985 [Penicillium alfredii]